ASGAQIVIVLDQVVLHQRRDRAALRVQLDSRDVVLDDVVENLKATVRPRKAWVRPDPGEEARVGQRRTLNREAVQLQVVGLELYRATRMLNDRLRGGIRQERPRPCVDAGLRAEQLQVVRVDVDHLGVGAGT